MMPKDVYAASTPSCDEGIPIEDYVESLGKWRLLPPLTRASYDVSVEVFGIYQECWYDYYLQIDEGNPIVIRVQNDVAGSLLDEPVVYTFAYRHQIYDLGGSMSWTPYTYVQYQGSFNLAKFHPVIPQSVLDDFDTYIQSELYVGCKDANNHVVRKYYNFICLNKGTETDYTSAILGVGSDIEALESTQHGIVPLSQYLFSFLLGVAPVFISNTSPIFIFSQPIGLFLISPNISINCDLTIIQYIFYENFSHCFD